MPGASQRGQDATLLNGVGLFAGVSPSDYTAIISAAREKRFDRGEVLFFEGEVVRQNILLVTGCVKVKQISSNGAEVILRLNGPGEIVGGVFGVGVRCEHCTTAQAIRSSVAVVWEVAEFERLLQRFPTFRQNANRAMEDRLRELEQRFREVSTEKVGIRVSSQLVRLYHQMGRDVGHGEVEVALSRSDLAQLTGTTLFTVSRLLCQWKSMGIVNPRREAVVLKDISALRQLAEGE